MTSPGSFWYPLYRAFDWRTLDNCRVWMVLLCAMASTRCTHPVVRRTPGEPRHKRQFALHGTSLRRTMGRPRQGSHVARIGRRRAVALGLLLSLMSCCCWPSRRYAALADTPFCALSHGYAPHCTFASCGTFSVTMDTQCFRSEPRAPLGPSPARSSPGGPDCASHDWTGTLDWRHGLPPFCRGHTSSPAILDQ